MKRMMRMVVVGMAVSGVGMAAGKTWVARCNDLEFQFGGEGGKAFLLMKTTDGLFQVATGKVTFDNGVARRATLDETKEDAPFTQVGLNRSRGIVYLVAKNPKDVNSKDGIYCHTEVSDLER